ncbi:MAG: sugar kinase [Candidatus Aerophobetes bacterium]|nr:sugar kinase [Candidatus Aerophobetes bacterium]
MDIEVGCVGDLLVEIMREKVDEPLDISGKFVGPFPSGASGIFIDTIAKLGVKAGFVGAVGKDDFGELIIGRLKKDKVDTSHIKMLDDYTTGVAFVTYFSDGSRKFIYHSSKAATGQIYPEDIKEDYFSKLKYLHIVGSTMSINENCREACQKAAGIVKESGGKVSFDPNFRPELLSEKEIREFFNPILSSSDVVLPTIEEAMVLTEKKNLKEACREILKKGPEIVAVKQGKEGSSIFSFDEELHIPAFEVKEIDPTGAGDCYCAGFIAGILKGMELKEAARFANAVGALAVTKKGPMEGAPTLEEVKKKIKIQARRRIKNVREVKRARM